MRPSSLLGHTIEVYSEFRENPTIPADAVIRKFYLSRKYLGAKDRRFIADAYFGTIKNWRRLEALVADCFDDQIVTATRTIAAYSISFLDESAESTLETFAEIPRNESVATDALIRLADREREEARLSALPIDEQLGIRFSYPKWFVSRIRAEYGEEVLPQLLTTLNGEAPTSLRVNSLITDRDALTIELREEGCETAFSRIAENAIILEKRVNVIGLPSFRRGAFEVQDEASQLVAPLAGIRKTAIKALDACAGAGGKTLHLSALMKNHGEIYATDVDDWKLEELKLRSRRSGAQNIRIVKQAEKAKILGENKDAWFDLVLLDVPCTGSGTVRRNPGIKWLLTAQMLDELVQKQRIILEENARFVKTGGTLLYATCSILKEEGEMQMEWFTSIRPEFQIEETLRTHPETDGCDGFFAARLRKVSAPPVV